jgi:hypothetical protein
MYNSISRLKLSFTSISTVPAYAGLRRFSEGRDFAQWTGDDSKALMKVLPGFFDMNIIIMCVTNRFISLPLLAMYHQ